MKRLFSLIAGLVLLVSANVAFADETTEPAVGLLNTQGNSIFSVDYLKQIVENAKQTDIYFAGGALSHKEEAWKEAYSVEFLTVTYLAKKFGIEPLSGFHLGIVDSREVAFSYEVHVDDVIRAVAKLTPGIAESKINLPEAFVFNAGYGVFGTLDEWNNILTSPDELDLDYGPFFKMSYNL